MAIKNWKKGILTNQWINNKKDITIRIIPEQKGYLFIVAKRLYTTYGKKKGTQIAFATAKKRGWRT